MAGIIFVILLINFIVFCVFAKRIRRKNFLYLWFFLTFPAPFLILLLLKVFFPDLPFLR